MADRLTVSARSALMAKVRGRGNATTEGALAQVFRAEGYVGWRRQLALRGVRRDGSAWRVRPDFVFVDGCFWHGCPQHGTQPQGNRGFWSKKFRLNRARDRRNTRDLQRAGWRVLRLWEHALKPKARAGLLRRLKRVLAVA